MKKGNRMLKNTLLTTLLLCTSLSAFSTVDEIRSEYKIIHNAVKKNLYRKKTKSTKEFVLPDLSKTVYLNPQGVVRKLFVEGGSAESVHSKSYFYTKRGRLFFTYERSGDVHKGANEIRRYYNDQMETIKEIMRPLKNGEHRISSVYPEVIEDALRYFKEEF
jgi:hypothetical protein